MVSLPSWLCGTILKERLFGIVQEKAALYGGEDGLSG